MEQIATAADVAKGTLYNYFPAKEAIISAHWQRMVADYQPQVTTLLQQAPDTRTRLKVLFREGLSYIRAHRDSYRIYLHYRLSQGADSRSESSGFRQLLAPLLRAGQENGEVRTDVDALWLAGHLEMCSLMLCLAWLAQPEAIVLEDGMDRTIDLFFDGAAAPAP